MPINEKVSSNSLIFCSPHTSKNREGKMIDFSKWSLEIASKAANSDNCHSIGLLSHTGQLSLKVRIQTFFLFAPLYILVDQNIKNYKPVLSNLNKNSLSNTFMLEPLWLLFEFRHHIQFSCIPFICQHHVFYVMKGYYG